MLMFPLEYVPVDQYPGYVWNLKEKKLFSFKGGTLKEMRLSWPGPIHGMSKKVPREGLFYCISHLGIKQYLKKDELMKLTQGFEVYNIKVKGE